MAKKAQKKSESTAKADAKKSDDVYAKELEWFRGKFAALAVSDAHTRHEIGAEVVKLQSDESKYGEGLVERLAKDLGMNASTLYDYAAVAKTWTSGEFQKLMEQKDKVHGLPPSWTTCVTLATKPIAKPKAEMKKFVKKLVKKTLDEDLKGPALVGMIKEESTGGRSKEVTGGSSTDPITVNKTVDEQGQTENRKLRDGIRHAKGKLDGFVSQLKNMDACVFSLLADASAESMDSDGRSQLKASEELLAKINDTCQDGRKKIADFLDSDGVGKKPTSTAEKSPKKPAAKTSTRQAKKVTRKKQVTRKKKVT